jgi:hypothetical protein
MRLTPLAVVMFLLAASTGVAADGPPEDFSVARFLDQASHIDAGTGKAATNDGLIIEFWNLDTRTEVDNWVVETGYGSTRVDPLGPESRTRAWRMATGFYLEKNTEVKVAYDRRDDENDRQTDRFALDITHVRRLKNGMSWSMNGFLAQLKRDSVHGKPDGTDAEVTAGWFFRDNMGIGARLAVGDREGSGDFTRYEAFAHYRIGEKTSFAVSYVNERIDEFNQKTNALMLGFTYLR